MSLNPSFRNGIRTDLACERRRADLSVPGVDYEEVTEEGFPVTRLKVCSAAGAKEIGRPEGTYLTVGFPPLFEMEEGERASGAALLAKYMTELLPARNGRPLLVTGLGNAALTADAIGPETVRRIPATAHLDSEGLCLFTPGVTWQSGTEAAALIRGVAKEIGVSGVIVIDALCARSPERLACTVQLCNTGITPGSGIRAPRSAIDRESVGAPVIALGVPTIVSSAALVYHALGRAGADEFPKEFRDLLGEDSFYVCPKSIDEGIENAARLLSQSISLLA